MVSACVLIRTSHGKFEEAVKNISRVKGIKKVFPVLGRYDVVADVEESNANELGEIILKLGHLVGVVFTETLLEIEH